MILIFEPNYAYKVFDEGTSVDKPYSFLLANDSFKLGEIANTFHYITGIHQTAFKQLKEERDKDLLCDDILKIVNLDCEVSELQLNYDI
jgi:hypothetical protein